MKNADIWQKLYYIIHFSLYIQLAILLLLISLIAFLILFICKTKAHELLPNTDNSLDSIDKQKRRSFSESNKEIQFYFKKGFRFR